MSSTADATLSAPSVKHQPETILCHLNAIQQQLQIIAQNTGKIPELIKTIHTRDQFIQDKNLDYNMNLLQDKNTQTNDINYSDFIREKNCTSKLQGVQESLLTEFIQGNTNTKITHGSEIYTMTKVQGVPKTQLQFTHVQGANPINQTQNANTEQGATSLNWTKECNKWLTPQKGTDPSDSSEIKMPKPFFSTPDSFNSVRVDLQKAFSGITTVTSDLDLSKHLQSINADLFSELPLGHVNLQKQANSENKKVVFPDPPLENLSPEIFPDPPLENLSPEESSNDILTKLMSIILKVFISAINMHNPIDAIEKNNSKSECLKSPITVPLGKTLSCIPKNNFGISNKKANNKKATEEKSSSSSYIHEIIGDIGVSSNKVAGNDIVTNSNEGQGSNIMASNAGVVSNAGAICIAGDGGIAEAICNIGYGSNAGAGSNAWTSSNAGVIGNSKPSSIAGTSSNAGTGISAVAGSNVGAISNTAAGNCTGVCSNAEVSRKAGVGSIAGTSNYSGAYSSTAAGSNAGTGGIIVTNNHNGARPKNNENTEQPSNSSVTVNISGISYSDPVRRDIRPLRSAPANKGDDTFDSHMNTKQNTKKRNDYSNIESDESDRDWVDGPLQLAPNPNKKFYEKQNQQPLAPPTRLWPIEIHNNPNYNYKSHGETFKPQYPQPYPQQATNRPNQPDKAQLQRPERIEKRSYHVSTTGPDGEVVLEQEATYEDGFEVVRSTKYKKKMKRMEKLRERTNRRELESAKSSISTRFILTKVDIDLTEEDVESYLLENFEEISDVYVRKNQMTHDKYATFVFIIYTENEIDAKMIEDHDWPGRIKCFFSPNDRRRRY